MMPVNFVLIIARLPVAIKVEEVFKLKRYPSEEVVCSIVPK